MNVFQHTLRRVIHLASRNQIDRQLTSDTNIANSFHKLPRVYLENSWNADSLISFQVDDETSHYMIDVMRLKTDSKVRGFNGQMGEHLFRLDLHQENKRKPVICKLTPIRQLRNPTAEDSSPCVLLFAPTKKERLKLSLEKATELGVKHMVPIVTQNTNQTLDAKTITSLEKVLIQSTEQSERLSIPTLHKQMSLSDLLSSTHLLDQPLDYLLVCRERDPTATPLLDVLLKRRTELFTKHSDTQPNNTHIGRFGLLVGPEGGFSSQEISELSSQSRVQFVSLGSSVLRAETAVIAALSIVSAVADSNNEIVK